MPNKSPRQAESSNRQVLSIAPKITEILVKDIGFNLGIRLTFKSELAANFCPIKAAFPPT